MVSTDADQWDGDLLLEQRNARVAEVHDGDETVGRHGDPTGSVQLAWPGTVRAELLHKNSRGGENLRECCFVLFIP